MSDLEVLKVRMEQQGRDINELKAILRSLVDTIGQLAVIEERQLQTSTALERVFATLKELDTRLSVLEREAPETRRVKGWIFGGILAALGVLFGFAATKLGLK